MRRLVVVVSAAVAGAALVTGCSSTGTEDDLQVAATLVAATPASSPAPTRAPEGTVLPAPPATAVLVDQPSRTLAVAVTQPPSLRLYALDDLAAAPRQVPLPGPVSALSPAGAGAVFASVPTAGQVVKITLPAGAAEVTAQDGGPVDAARVGDRTLVARHEAKSVAVLAGSSVQRSIDGIASPDLVVPVGDHAVLLDRLRSAVYDLNPDNTALGAGLRAGDGATNAVPDRYGRVLVTDTRGGGLLAFSTMPVLMRQRFPVPGAPYGIAYDERRDLAWVTLTERNEVVGFDVAGGEPVERHRVPAVRQPDSVAVDSGTGRVFVASADGGGVQVVQP